MKPNMPLRRRHECRGKIAASTIGSSGGLGDLFGVVVILLVPILVQLL